MRTFVRPLALLGFVLLLGACTGGSDGTPTPEATPTVGGSSTPPVSTSTPPPAATREPTRTPTVVPTPAAGSFAVTGPLAEPRSGHSATLLRDGRVLIAGGSRLSPGGIRASAELFDPATGHFKAIGDMTAPRTHHSATLLDDGRVLIAGGGRLNGTGITSAELYDPDTETFMPTGDMQIGRWGKTAALLDDGRVLVAGGGAEGDRAAAELFDPVTGTWMRTGDLNVSRFGHNLTALADGRVLVSGFGPLELYEPNTGQFRLLAGETPGDLPTATLLLDGRVLLIGGNDLAEFTPGQPNGHGSGPATARAVAFDPLIEELTDAGEMLQVRTSHSAVLLDDGRVLVSGGAQDVHHDEPLLNSAELWDPATETFAATGSMDERRFGHTMTLLSDGSVLVVGTIFDVDEAHAQRYVAPPRMARSISGLFTSPRPVPEPDLIHSLGPLPESPFDPWNGEDVILYDTLTMSETNLGPGSIGFPSFNPSATRFMWSAGTHLNPDGIWVLDLASGERFRVADGIAFRWLDDDTLYGRRRATLNVNERLSVPGGEWSDASDVDPNGVAGRNESTVSRWTLESLQRSEYPFWSTTFRLSDRSAVLGPLVFEAHRAVLAPDGALFVAVAPAEVIAPLPDFDGLEAGETNIFHVDPRTGEATFIASAEVSAPNWAFAASSRHVGWMDGFCGQDFASIRTSLFDRESGELAAVEGGMWFEFTSAGLIADGAFGARRLIDPVTLETVVALPEGLSDVSWSSDHRYAAVGVAGGHGGLCG